MLQKRRFLVTVSAFFAALLTARGAQAQCSGYSVDILPGPDCKFVPSDANASAVNEAGELCGAYFNCSTGEAAVWLGEGPWIPLVNYPKGFMGFNPLDMNLSRKMAGTTRMAQNPEHSFAAIYDFETSSMTNLGALPGHTESEAVGINSSNVVVGNSNNAAVADQLRAFLWQNGDMSVLPMTYGTTSFAFDISDSGKICGRMGNHPSLDSHAFIFDLATGILTDVGLLLDGATGSRATGVNNAGTICGFSAIPCGQSCTVRRSFIWSNGVVQDLGVLPGNTNTFARAINDSNVVIGYCDPIPTTFVWRNGKIYTLNDLIPPELNLDLQTPSDINNAGQIVGLASVIGSGGDRVAVRLTPMPSPIGDFNCDATVNVDDLLGVINNWAKTPPQGAKWFPPGDFDHDGIVELDDLMIVIDNWGL
jgi:probable HAF family extracellular repeat protein